MYDWLARLGGWQRSKPETPELLQAIERAIYLVDPRLKQAGGYPDRYCDMVSRALHHAESLAAALASPIDLDREHFILDPFVHTLFASADDIRRTLSLSRAMQDYQRGGNPPGGDLYALMGMRRNEKNAFGLEVEGTQVRRDVAQQIVSFSDHTLSCVAASESACRSLLAWDIFDSLIGRVSSRLESLRQERQVIDQARDTVMARLRGADADRKAALQDELEALLVKLRELTASLDYRQVARLFDELLQSPESHIRLEQRQFQLDNMGILRRPDDAAISHPIVFTDLIGLDRRCWSVVLVRCRFQELPPMADRLETAHRWLSS